MKKVDYVLLAICLCMFVALWFASAFVLGVVK